MIGSGKARINTIKAFIPNSKHGHESEIEAYLLSEAHVLYFGSSGSRKTDTVLAPNIIMNAHSKD